MFRGFDDDRQAVVVEGVQDVPLRGDRPAPQLPPRPVGEVLLLDLENRTRYCGAVVGVQVSEPVDNRDDLLAGQNAHGFSAVIELV
jgi:hypothetical protein